MNSESGPPLPNKSLEHDTRSLDLYTSMLFVLVFRTRCCSFSELSESKILISYKLMLPSEPVLKYRRFEIPDCRSNFRVRLPLRVNSPLFWTTHSVFLRTFIIDDHLDFCTFLFSLWLVKN